jgi:hypothetical protein
VEVYRNIYCLITYFNIVDVLGSWLISLALDLNFGDFIPLSTMIEIYYKFAILTFVLECMKLNRQERFMLSDSYEILEFIK